MPSTPLSRSFGSEAERYERGRPSWPAEAVDALGVPRDATVLDLGAGTGKLTRLLVERFARVVALEPLPEMRAILATAVPGAELIDGVAEQIPLGAGTVDAVVSGEAFHWFEGLLTVREIARVLRPGGVLAILRNRADETANTEPPIPLVHEFLERNRPPAEHPIGRIDSGEWLVDFADGCFDPIAEARYSHVQETTRDALVDYFGSVSWIAALPAAERSALIGELRSLLPDMTFRRSWQTVVYSTRRR